MSYSNEVMLLNGCSYSTERLLQGCLFIIYFLIYKSVDVLHNIKLVKADVNQKSRQETGDGLIQLMNYCSFTWTCFHMQDL